MSYDLFKYEIECLVNSSHADEVIRQVIRRAVKGEAAHILKRLGPSATVQQIIAKFDGVYGEVGAGEERLAEFYSAKQEVEETVSSWSCRLEGMIDRALQARSVDKSNVNSMLCKRLWAGLIPRLKEATRHKFDSINNFDELRVAIRSVEHEFSISDSTKSKTPLQTCKASNPQENFSKTVSDLTSQVSSLQKEVESLRKGQSFRQVSGSRSARSRVCFNCSSPNHIRSECPKLPECLKCHKRGHRQQDCYLNRQ